MTLASYYPADSERLPAGRKMVSVLLARRKLHFSPSADRFLYKGIVWYISLGSMQPICAIYHIDFDLLDKIKRQGGVINSKAMAAHRYRFIKLLKRGAPPTMLKHPRGPRLGGEAQSRGSSELSCNWPYDFHMFKNKVSIFENVILYL